MESATILVVDDHPSIVKLCQAVLAGAGFEVLGAESSSDALRIFAQRHKRIDLLLTDLILPPSVLQFASNSNSNSNSFPHLNGYQLAVRAATIQKGLRIIIMSGNPDRELADHGITRGALPFITKPFGKDDLIILVRSVLTRTAPVLNWFG